MNPAYVNAVDMLPMPNTQALAAEQIEGTVCVWCAGVPTLKLGPRLMTAGGRLERWWPTACQTCASREAARVQGIHIRTCARCTSHTHCPDVRALHALATQTPAAGAAPRRRRDGGRKARGWDERPQ